MERGQPGHSPIPAPPCPRRPASILTPPLGSGNTRSEAVTTLTVVLLVPDTVIFEAENPRELRGLPIVGVVTSFLGCLNQNTKSVLPSR